MSVLCAIKHSVSYTREERGERITYFTITAVHICSEFIRENSELLLLNLGSFGGIAVHLSCVIVSLMRIKLMYAVTLKFLFLPVWKMQ